MVENSATPSNQGVNSRRYAARLNSDLTLYGNNTQSTASYPYQQSYDTGGSNSANESHGTDQWGNSTDPSSENSSIDRVPQASKPDLGEVYGFNGFGGAPQFQGPILEEHSHGAPAYGQLGYGQSQMAMGNGHPYQGNGTSIGPAPPPHTSFKGNAPRVPIKLGNSSIIASTSSVNTSEKRKSWLKRRFSKN